MTLQPLLAQITLGEDSTRQLRADVKNAESLSSEMATFDNTGGMFISGHVDLISDRLSMEAAA
jgi:hypothetical protein